MLRFTKAENQEVRKLDIRGMKAAKGGTLQVYQVTYQTIGLAYLSSLGLAPQGPELGGFYNTNPLQNPAADGTIPK